MERRTQYRSIWEHDGPTTEWMLALIVASEYFRAHNEAMGAIIYKTIQLY